MILPKSSPQPPHQPLVMMTGDQQNHIVFDFDLWCYDIGFAAQGKDGTLMPFSYCTDLIDTRFTEIMQKLNGSTYEGYLTGTGNFRHSVGTVKPYKGNRTAERPHWYKQIRQYLVLNYNAVIVDGYEADDACAMVMHSRPMCICVTRDKDLKQVPGRMFSYKVGKQAEYLYENLRNWYHSYCFFSQVLTGDTTDNYPGLPGCGPVKAMNILTGCETAGDMFDAVLNAYRGYYFHDANDRFLEQATLAWMVRQLYDDGSPVTPTLDKEFYDGYYPDSGNVDNPRLT